MKNIALLVAFVMLSTATFFAQTITVQDSGSIDFDPFVQTAFANVNTTGLTTGKLMNRSPQFIDIEVYDGSQIADSLAMNMDKFSALYAMTYSSALSSTYQLPDPLLAYNNNSTLGTTNRLYLLAQKYNWFSPNAMGDGRVYVSNNKYYTSGTTGLYVEDTIFAATLERSVNFGTSATFQLPTDKIFNNWGTTITSLTVDWGDGLGNRSYSVGTTVTINYPSIGIKNIILSCTAPNGKILKTRMDIEIKSPISNFARLNTRGPNDGYIDDALHHITIPVTATKSYLGAANSTLVDVFFACDDQIIRKPLFIVDGFEPLKFNSLKASEVLRILEYDKTPNTNRDVIPQIIRTLGEDLKAEGYDLVFVDFNKLDPKKGRDYVQRNAYLLEAVITEINNRKRSPGVNSTEKNVMISFSMGGLVSKYALLDMEKTNPNAEDGGHDVKTFISYDSPLRGANIALGLQGFLNHFGNYRLAGVTLKTFQFGLRFGEEVLTSPAAKQMVYYQAFAPNMVLPPDFIAFQNEFQAMGINSNGRLLKCSHKAIANGSITGVKQFEPGTTLFQGTKFELFTDFTLPNATVIGKALPPSGTSGFVYDGTIDPSFAKPLHLLGPLGSIIQFLVAPKSNKKILVSNVKPYDSAPGAKTALGTDRFPPFIQSLQLTSCFIPTVSALDLNSSAADNVLFPVSDVQQVLNQNITNIKSYEGSRSVASNDGNAFRLKTLTDKDGNLTGIEDAFSGPDNQDHVALSYRNTGYLLYELTTRSGLSKVSGILNSRTYNFGASNALYSTPAPGQLVPREVNNIINYNLTVSDVGKLWVNRRDKIEFTDVPTNPDNTLNTRYDLHIKNQQSQACGNGVAPSVTLQNGGKMLAGDDLQGNYANVTVWSGATINVNAGGEATYEGGSNLIVESGGVVNIRDGGLQEAQWGGKVTIRNGGIIHVWNAGRLKLSIYSLLEIENGGQLIIDAGANVELSDGSNGPGGTTIDGRCGIIVKTGGQLIINGQFNLSGNGYFRFEQGHVLTLNTDILLRGYRKDVQMIRIADGASLIINGHKLTLENGLVRRETGSTPSRHIQLTNNGTSYSSIFATNVTFEDNSTFATFGERAFIYIENPTDPDAIPAALEDIDYSFTNCTFQGNGNLVQLNTITATPNDYEFLNLNIVFTDCTFTGGTAFNANRCRVATFLRCQLNRSGIVLSNAYWLDMRQTTMRGYVSNPIIFNPSASTAIKLKTVIHGEIYDNSTIDNYDIGIDATEGWNNGVKLMSGAKIQNCYTAVKLIGGINNAYGFDWGMMYMDCASLINNVYGITGKDIQFNMYGRGGTTIMQNVSSEIQQNISDWRYVDAEFQARVSTTDVWLHDSYWTGGAAPNAGTQFRFIQRNPHFPEPWTGTLHLDNPILNDPNTNTPNDFRIDRCGGLGLRGSDPFSGKTEIILAGGRYDTKVQHDAAMVKMREKKFDQSVNLFRPLANVPAVIYERSSPEARHFIDNARIWVSYKGLTPRGANDGWLPEAFVGFTRKIDNLFILKPNPVNTEFEIQLLAGSYEISVFDALGKLILLKNTEGVTQVNTTDWQNGIYFVKVTDKSTNKVQNSKVIVQH